MRWKLMLPADREYTVQIGTSESLMPDDFPDKKPAVDAQNIASTSNATQVVGVLPPGISEVSVVVQQGSNGKLRVISEKWGAPGAQEIVQTTAEIDDTSRLFSRPSYHNRLAGQKYTQSCKADQPMVLASIREHTQGAASPGLIVWIEPRQQN